LIREEAAKKTFDVVALGELLADLFEMLQLANAAASLITTRKGALRVMPKYEEITALIEDKSK